jgi:hypothetical protein
MVGRPLGLGLGISFYFPFVIYVGLVLCFVVREMQGIFYPRDGFWIGISFVPSHGTLSLMLNKRLCQFFQIGSSCLTFRLSFGMYRSLRPLERLWRNLLWQMTFTKIVCGVRWLKSLWSSIHVRVYLNRWI